MNRQEIKILAAMGMVTLVGCTGNEASSLVRKTNTPDTTPKSNSQCGGDWQKIIQPFTKPYAEEDFPQGLILTLGKGNKRLNNLTATEAIDAKTGKRVMSWPYGAGSQPGRIEEIYDQQGRKIAERKVMDGRVDTIWIADYNGVGDYRRFTEYVFDEIQCVKLNDNWSPANIVIDGRPGWREDQSDKPGKIYEPYNPQPFPTPSFNQRFARDFISPWAKLASRSSMRRF